MHLGGAGAAFAVQSHVKGSRCVRQAYLSSIQPTTPRTAKMCEQMGVNVKQNVRNNHRQNLMAMACYFKFCEFLDTIGISAKVDIASDPTDFV